MVSLSNRRPELGEGFATQRGFTLIETVIAVAIVAIALGGIFFASAAVSRFGTHQQSSVAVAAAQFAQQVLRTAENAWKYGSPGKAAPAISGTWPTSVPVVLPDGGATSAPVSVSVTSSELTTPAPNDPTRESASIAVTVNYNGGSVPVEAVVRVKAPVPGTLIDSGVIVTPPPGAP